MDWNDTYIFICDVLVPCAIEDIQNLLLFIGQSSTEEATVLIFFCVVIGVVPGRERLFLFHILVDIYDSDGARFTLPVPIRRRYTWRRGLFSAHSLQRFYATISKSKMSTTCINPAKVDNTNTYQV